ncbi:hypothetical protein [Vibrio paucivorans]|uniref:Uncharacterized protein n=1 Tax=Vibrio paucivorans TaxID=2829489 RepID=A0A9X3CEA8_9VIBR|nr:hypothetical protein [Vibrio paucivorans]MCW8334193.1 hypothetical protein [Vibrio paucivorans]
MTVRILKPILAALCLMGMVACSDSDGASSSSVSTSSLQLPEQLEVVTNENE